MTDGRATANAKKESFWSDVFMKVGCVPQDEMVVVADDMNGHVGNSNLGYSGIPVSYTHLTLPTIYSV